MCILFAVFLLLLLWLFIKGPKYKGKLKYRYNLPLVLVGFLAFAGVTQLALEKRVLSNYFGNIAFAYEDYGYPYCLATTIFNTGISCPRDYSDKEITRIQKTEENLPETKEGSHPNIIFLQLESFLIPHWWNIWRFPRTRYRPSESLWRNILPDIIRCRLLVRELQIRNLNP